MIGSVGRLVLLAVFSGIAMNLILHFGIGLKGIAFDAYIGRKKLLAGSGILFVSIILLWLFFSYIGSLLFLGFMEYVVIFPASFAFFCFLEYLTNRFIIKSKQDYEDSLAGGSFTGAVLAGAALFIMLNVAGGLLDAVVLALGFAGSTALVFAVVAEIRRRSKMEAVPQRLQGGPLALVAMGLLALVFSSGAMMLLAVLGAG